MKSRVVHGRTQPTSAMGSPKWSNWALKLNKQTKKIPSYSKKTKQKTSSPPLRSLWLKMLPRFLFGEWTKLQFSRKQGQTCTSTSRFSTSDQVRHQLLKNVSCTDWKFFLFFFFFLRVSFKTLFLFRTCTGTRMGRSRWWSAASVRYKGRKHAKK